MNITTEFATRGALVLTIGDVSMRVAEVDLRDFAEAVEGAIRAREPARVSGIRVVCAPRGAIVLATRSKCVAVTNRERQEFLVEALQRAAHEERTTADHWP